MVTTLIPVFLSVVSLASAVAPATIHTYLNDYLSSGSEVFFPSDAAYTTELTKRWSAYDAPNYVIGVKPAIAEDVSIIINFFSFSGFTTDAQMLEIDAFAERRRAAFAKANGADKGLEVYVNYAHGNEGRDAWYGADKLPRLSTIKSTWDPSNLFNFTNGFVL
ncbi:hypothetical protein EJ02DRAFT_462368 [Clathrospora elynae]|uniref:Berberine/berberine-like domain-containing protein n=1 Tax=Clathrospora elynae TaxID=706981 RepID=A0A6A5T141_9PLEO|nr:hypothetical protein EJ02DRAFT_462368 [Clathrospora elynae]